MGRRHDEDAEIEEIVSVLNTEPDLPIRLRNESSLSFVLRCVRDLVPRKDRQTSDDVKAHRPHSVPCPVCDASAPTFESKVEYACTECNWRGDPIDLLWAYAYARRNTRELNRALLMSVSRKPG